MATIDERVTSGLDAGLMRQNIQDMYANSKDIVEKLTRYQGETDSAFNGAINAIFTTSERVDLGAMLTQLQTLITDWETNYPDILGIA